MPPPTDRTTLWQELRSWPRPVQFGFAALAAAVFAVTFVLEPLAAHDFPDPSEWPEGVIPDGIAVGTVDGPDEPGSGLPEDITVYQGDPLWSADLTADGEQVAEVDQGILRLTDEWLELERDGATVWTQRFEAYAEVGVADEVVVIAESIEEDAGGTYEWPGRLNTFALDLDTGDEVWRDDDASFVTVFADAVIMTECTGEQDDHIGDCTLHSRDPADLSEQWSTPTYASAEPVTDDPWNAGPAPDRLLVESYPTGYDSRTVDVYEDGESLVSVETPYRTALADDTLIAYDDYDDNPADGCTATLTGHRFGESAAAWEIEAMTRKTADLASCGTLPTDEPRDGKLPLTIDGVPSIMDVATGETVWEAPAEGQAIALSPKADLLVIADWEAEEDNLVAYDTATGEERWRANASFSSDDHTRTIGSTLWLHGSGTVWGLSSYDVYAYDLATGEGVALPGTAGYYLPGWIITTTENSDATEHNVWPTELW
jgi:hypothetical protein